MVHRVCTDDDVAIEYEVYGSGPQTVLFLHGWGNAASFWRDLLSHHGDLASLRCGAASYRGHGGSDKPATGCTHERFSQEPWRVSGKLLMASCGPRPFPVDRAVLASWVATAACPDRMREFLMPFTKRPLPAALIYLYCAEAARASHAIQDVRLHFCGREGTAGADADARDR